MISSSQQPLFIPLQYEPTRRAEESQVTTTHTLYYCTHTHTHTQLYTRCKCPSQPSHGASPNLKAGRVGRVVLWTGACWHQLPPASFGQGIVNATSNESHSSSLNTHTAVRAFECIQPSTVVRSTSLLCRQQKEGRGTARPARARQQQARPTTTDERKNGMHPTNHRNDPIKAPPAALLPAIQFPSTACHQLRSDRKRVVLPERVRRRGRQDDRRRNEHGSKLMAPRELRARPLASAAPLPTYSVH